MSTNRSTARRAACAVSPVRLGSRLCATPSQRCVVRSGQKNNELVALKRMKGTFKTWDECLKLREIQSLKGLQCANVVRLIEAVSTPEYRIVPLQCVIEAVRRCSAFNCRQL